MIDDAGLPPLDEGQYTTLRRMLDDEKRRVVVSFGGGGLPGICGNIALAEVFERLGLRDRVEQIWGTSAGAVVGGGWASGASAAEILAQTRALKGRRTIDTQWLLLLRAILLRPFGRSLPDGLIRGQRFADAIEAGLRVPTFEECPTPFRCIAVSDDGSLRRMIFKKGPLLPAIFASMSLPGVVIPRRVAGEPCGFYDGGIVEKTPLISPIAEHARLGDGRELLLICSHFDNEANKIPARGFLARFLQTIYAMEDQMWQYQRAEARKRDGVTLLLLNPKVEDRALFDFNRVDDNLRDAYRAFADRLQNGKIGLALGGD